jgi:hypothetical protein
MFFICKLPLTICKLSRNFHWRLTALTSAFQWYIVQCNRSSGWQSGEGSEMDFSSRMFASLSTLSKPFWRRNFNLSSNLNSVHHILQSLGLYTWVNRIFRLSWTYAIKNDGTISRQIFPADDRFFSPWKRYKCNTHKTAPHVQFINKPRHDRSETFRPI